LVDQEKKHILKLSRWVAICEPIRFTTGLDQVGLKILYKISIWVDFWPNSFKLNMWWTRLTYQPANKGLHKYYFIKLSFAFGSG